MNSAAGWSRQPEARCNRLPTGSAKTKLPFEQLWSNRQIAKLKQVNRQMFSRVKRNFMRARVLQAT